MKQTNSLLYNGSGILNENSRSHRIENKKHFTATLRRVNQFNVVRQKLTRSKIRLLALLPLAFFLAQGLHYWEINELGHMLWMCNIGNLMLAIGIYFEKPLLVRVAVIWAIPGFIVWCIYVVPTWGMLLSGQFTWSQLFAVASSSLAHMGGTTIGLVVLQRIGMSARAWLYAFGWYFIVQFLARLLTPSSMNVNLAHRVQDGFEQTFPVYWKFWLLLTVLVGLGSWLVGWGLRKKWPSIEPHLETGVEADARPVKLNVEP